MYLGGLIKTWICTQNICRISQQEMYSFLFCKHAKLPSAPLLLCSMLFVHQIYFWRFNVECFPYQKTNQADRILCKQWTHFDLAVTDNLLNSIHTVDFHLLFTCSLTQEYIIITLTHHHFSSSNWEMLHFFCHVAPSMVHVSLSSLLLCDKSCRRNIQEYKNCRSCNKCNNSVSSQSPLKR